MMMKRVRVEYRPLGVIGAIVPWNCTSVHLTVVCRRSTGKKRNVVFQECTSMCGHILPWEHEYSRNIVYLSRMHRSVVDGDDARRHHY